MPRPIRFGDDFTPTREWAEAWPSGFDAYFTQFRDAYRDRVNTYWAEEYAQHPGAFLLMSPVEVVAVATLGAAWVFAQPAEADSVRVVEAWEHEVFADWDFTQAPDDHRALAVTDAVLPDGRWHLVHEWDVTGSINSTMQTPQFYRPQERGHQLADADASGARLQRALEGLGGDVRELNHTFFGSVDATPEEDLCFVLMPFHQEFDEVWEDGIRPPALASGLRPVRADDLYGSRPIMRDVWEYILRSRVLIADLTNRNPNVFYELGLAHAIEKNVVLLTQSVDDVPFDLRHVRVIQYGTTKRGIEALHEALRKTLDELLKEPVSHIGPSIQAVGAATVRRELQGSRELTPEPYIAFNFNSTFMNGEPYHPAVSLENFGQGAALHVLYCARYMWEDAQVRPPDMGEHLIRYYRYPPASRIASPFHLGPGTKQEASLTAISNPEPDAKSVFSLMPPQLGLVQVAVCEDQAGTRYRFRSDQVDIERWRPGESPQGWETWIPLRRSS